MALTRRIKKLTKSMVAKISGRQILTCSECNYEEVEVPSDIKKVTCAHCVQKMIAPPPNYKKEKSDKPRGWHFKKFFEHDGVVYSMGEVITDEEQIITLRKEHKSTKSAIKKQVKKTTKKRSKRDARTTK